MDVFVSFANADRQYAQRLAASLQQRGISVYLDASVLVGDSWASEIHRFIADSDAFVVLLSESTTQGEHVASEIAAATVASRERNIRLVPVILDERAEVPPLLSLHKGVMPPMSRDPERVASLIEESLRNPVRRANVDLQHEIIDIERANLHIALTRQLAQQAASSARLAQLVGLGGAVTGIAATAIAFVALNGGAGFATGVLTVVSLASASLGLAVSLFSRRSRDGR